jgi:hypothetical protein
MSVANNLQWFLRAAVSDTENHRLAREQLEKIIVRGNIHNIMFTFVQKQPKYQRKNINPSSDNINSSSDNINSSSDNINSSSDNINSSSD